MRKYKISSIEEAPQLETIIDQAIYKYLCIYQQHVYRELLWRVRPFVSYTRYTFSFELFIKCVRTRYVLIIRLPPQFRISLVAFVARSTNIFTVLHYCLTGRLFKHIPQKMQATHFLFASYDASSSLSIDFCPLFANLWDLFSRTNRLITAKLLTFPRKSESRLRAVKHLLGRHA